jgi:recombination protein RecA
VSLSLAELIRLLPPPAPVVPALPTGIAALDAVLQGGGLPRGRLTELLGPTGGGKTTLARVIVERTVQGHGWVAYIDAQRTLDPRDWTHLGEAEGVWMIRPHDATRAAWCADVLLRSGAFALVVLDGAPLLSKSNAVRLTRLARDGNCALLVLGDRAGGATQLGGAVRLLVERPRGRTRDGAGTERGRSGDGLLAPKSLQAITTIRTTERGRSGDPDTLRVRGGLAGPESTRTIAVRVEKGGTLRTVEVSCAVAVARRLCTHPEVPDRRGVARGPAGGSRHARGGPGQRPAAASPQPAGRAGAGAGPTPGPGVPTRLHTAVTRARALG